MSAPIHLDENANAFQLNGGYAEIEKAKLLQSTLV